MTQRGVRWCLLSLLIAYASGEPRAQDVFNSGSPQRGRTGTQGVEGNPNCPPPVVNGVTPKNWSCKTGTQASSGLPQIGGRTPRRALPKVVASRDASPAFVAALDACLDAIAQQAAREPGSPTNRLLNALERVPVTIHPRAATDTSNGTANSPPGGPVDITWGPKETTRYADGASKLPCAALLHELTHAWEFFNGYDNGELQAVRAENWLIWRLGGTQRRTYQGTPLPAEQVRWPQGGR